MKGGEDKLDLIFGVAWRSWHTTSWAYLDAQKKAAQEAGHAVESRFQGPPFLVEAQGRGGAVYNLTFAGMRFLLQRAEMPSDARGNVKVEVGSLALMQWGAERCFKMATTFLRRLGATYMWSKVTRVDVCLDVVGPAGREICEAMQAGLRVTRADTWCPYYRTDGDVLTGITVGSGSIQLRVYDKLRELQDHRSGSMEKRLILEQERWKCSPSEAWRFEFQVRREALRQFEVDSFEDWREKRQDVIKYLTEQWIRFTDDKPTKGNAARATTSETWLSVVAGFVEWAGRSALKKVVRAYKKSVDGMGDTKRRVRAAVSALVGVAVEELGGDLNSFFAQDVVERLIHAAFKVEDFDEAVYRNVRKVMKRTLVPNGKRPLFHYQDFLRDLSTKALAFQEEHGTSSYYEDEIEFTLA